jgi:hypothetical protein
MDHIAMGVFDVFRSHTAVEREHEAAIATAAQMRIVNCAAPQRAPIEGSRRAVQRWRTHPDDPPDGMTPMEFILRSTCTNPDLTRPHGTINPAHPQPTDILQQGRYRGPLRGGATPAAAGLGTTTVRE